MNMIKILCPLCTLPVCWSCIPCLVLSVFSQRCSRRRRLCSPVSLRSKRFRFVLAQIKNEEGQPKTARKSRSLVSLCSEPKRKRLLRRLLDHLTLMGKLFVFIKYFMPTKIGLKKKLQLLNRVRKGYLINARNKIYWSRCEKLGDVARRNFVSAPDRCKPCAWFSRSRFYSLF